MRHYSCLTRYGTTVICNSYLYNNSKNETITNNIGYSMSQFSLYDAIFNAI